MINPYHVLQVSSQASFEVIKAAYHALSKKYSQDKGGSKVFAQQLNEAYEILSDSTKLNKWKLEQSNPKQIGNYQIIEKIAEGGFGTTYKARHLLVDELVCLKHCTSISSVHDQVLIDEAKVIWNFRHWALPVMKDLIRHEDGSLILVQSYIPGQTLKQIVEKVGKLDIETVCWITERKLNALQYLHFHGVMHGDIKPQNIIIQPERHAAVLIDFGLSMSQPTSSSKSLGYTPYFSPPEQIAKKPLLPASDLYALGKVLIYALGGGLDYVKRLEIPTSVPPELAKWIKSLIAHDILSRPQEVKFEEFQALRLKICGSSRSNMKPIKGL